MFIERCTCRIAGGSPMPQATSSRFASPLQNTDWTAWRYVRLAPTRPPSEPRRAPGFPGAEQAAREQAQFRTEKPSGSTGSVSAGGTLLSFTESEFLMRLLFSADDLRFEGERCLPSTP